MTHEPLVPEARRERQRVSGPERTEAARRLIEYYERTYTEDAATARSNFVTGRTRVAAFIHSLVCELRPSVVLDVGCSYGTIVELCNGSGISTFGVDLPLEELRRFHATLKNSRDRFIYGALDALRIQEVRERCGGEIDMLLVIDTLRHLPDADALAGFEPEYVVIKETARSRRLADEWRRRFSASVRLWAPEELLDLFPQHDAVRIYGSRGIGPISRPGRFVLRAVNRIFPSYTLVLQRRGPRTEPRLDAESRVAAAALRKRHGGA